MVVRKPLFSIFHFRTQVWCVTCTINPQVPDSSPGLGATDLKGKMPGREMGFFVFRPFTGHTAIVLIR